MNVPGQPAPAAALAEGLAQVRDVLAELVKVDLHDVPGQVLLDAVEAVEGVRRQVAALAARTLATVEAQGMWALDGSRSLAAWYRGRTGVHGATAAREVRQARALRDVLPGTAKALAAGEISTDHAATMVRQTTSSPARRGLLADPELGETLLLAQAKALDGTDFAVAAARWSQQADPDAADRGYREDLAREEFYLSETTDGYVPGGWLSKASGQALATALAARVGMPSTADTRSPAQRRAAALVALARLALDGGVLKPGARIRPHLAVHVPFETLQRLIAAAAPAHRPGCLASGAYPGVAFGLPPELTRLVPAASPPSPGSEDADMGSEDGDDGSGGPCTCGAEHVIGAELDPAWLVGAPTATFDDGVVIPPALLGRIVCASELHRVVFGPESEVLDVGREERLFTAAQTRAIVARDKRCQYPRCHAPPGEGEIHHSIWWYTQFGSTSVRLGVLLCWYHHDYVHAHAITIAREGERWVFRRADGTVIPGE
ncbi:DUF222 domain-containing protein [Georgenia thermotolerans]|uniref:DUF222 domain-containing protein n=1 Tax=Georgenia thermotolerans TaxID=527326 RepID=UPI00186B3A34|nr:DUF222 domain-containing protein [Georgenia thermotolerans]